MKKVLSLVLAGILLLFCTACQPTPEEENVARQDPTLVKERLSTQPIPDEGGESYKSMVDAYKATLPTHWSDYTESEYIQMPIEADIIVENTDGFPVYRIKRNYFNMDLAESIANQMMPKVTGIREGTQPLPEEYAAAIRSLNERGMVEYAESVFEDAKEAAEGSYTETDYIHFTDEKNQFYVVQFADGKLGQVFMKAYNENNCRLDICSSFDSIIHLRELVAMGGSYEGEGDIILTPSITQEQAEEALITFLQKNGLENYYVDDVNAARHFAFLTREEISQGWRFELVPAYDYYAMDAVKIAKQSGGWLHLNAEEKYAATWNMENLFVYISENGVEYIQWNNPLEVLECVNPCVELMEFEEIQKKLLKLLTAGIAWFERPCCDEPTVTKVVLTTVPQQMKDDPDAAYLMPVWVCVIDWHTTGTEYHSYELIGLNAIDGSRVTLG